MAVLMCRRITAGGLATPKHRAGDMGAVTVNIAPIAWAWPAQTMALDDPTAEIGMDCVGIAQVQAGVGDRHNLSGPEQPQILAHPVGVHNLPAGNIVEQLHRLV